MNEKNVFLADCEQKKLIKSAQEGNVDAKRLVIENNYKLVCSLIQRFCGRGIEYEDLLQIGLIGLLKAIENFNIEYDNKFSTYAVPMIMGEIKRAIRDDQPIHVSRSYKELGYKISQVKKKYINQNNREPTIKELSEILDTSVEKIATALEANLRPQSLQTPFENKNSSKTMELQDLIKDKDCEENWVTDIVLKEIFERLDTRLRYIMLARYYKELTQQQIADKLGISQVQVSRLEKQALLKMREYLKSI